jgi:hypothetical protein
MASADDVTRHASSAITSQERVEEERLATHRAKLAERLMESP